MRLAECLIPLTHENEDTARELLTEECNSISEQFSREWRRRMTAKLGLTFDDNRQKEDDELVTQWVLVIGRQRALQERWSK